MNFGVITNLKISGNSAFRPDDAENSKYLRRVKQAGKGFISISHAKDDGQYNIEINVDEAKKLTIVFRNAADEVLKTVTIREKHFYEKAAAYKAAIAAHHNAQTLNRQSRISNDELIAADTTRSAAHKIGTEALVQILRKGKPPIAFGGEYFPQHDARVRALFYLCAHAIPG